MFSDIHTPAWPKFPTNSDGTSVHCPSHQLSVLELDPADACGFSPEESIHVASPSLYHYKSSNVFQIALPPLGPADQ